MPNPEHYFRVAGVSFRSCYPANIHRVAEAHRARNAHCFECTERTRKWCKNCRGTGIVGGPLGSCASFILPGPEPLNVVLIRDPHNTEDPNAVEVHLPGLTPDGNVGCLPAAEAALIAPVLDNGVKFRAGVAFPMIMDDKPDKPGLVIVVQQIGSSLSPYLEPQDPRDLGRRPEKVWGQQSEHRRLGALRIVKGESEGYATG